MLPLSTIISKWETRFHHDVTWLTSVNICLTNTITLDTTPNPLPSICNDFSRELISQAQVDPQLIPFHDDTQVGIFSLSTYLSMVISTLALDIRMMDNWDENKECFHYQILTMSRRTRRLERILKDTTNELQWTSVNWGDWKFSEEHKILVETPKKERRWRKLAEVGRLEREK